MCIDCYAQAVQEVLQRVRLLVRAGDYGAARDLLRGREVGLLTQDLGYGTEAYRLFPQQVRREQHACSTAACRGNLGHSVRLVR